MAWGYFIAGVIILYQNSNECRHINNDFIAVSLVPDEATAKHGKIARQFIQE